MCVYTYIMYIYICIYIVCATNTCPSVCVCICIYTHVRTWVCRCTHVFACLCKCTRTFCLYMHAVRVFMHVCVYIYIHGGLGLLYMRGTRDPRLQSSGAAKPKPLAGLHRKRVGRDAGSCRSHVHCCFVMKRMHGRCTPDMFCLHTWLCATDGKTVDSRQECSVNVQAWIITTPWYT